MSAWKPQAKNLKLDSHLEKIVLYTSMKFFKTDQKNAVYLILQFFLVLKMFNFFVLTFVGKTT